MRNFDKYKTIDELMKVMSEFCHKHECRKCKYGNGYLCHIQFGYDEYVEENHKEKKYRPYTREEAIPLVGKILYIPKTDYSFEVFKVFEFKISEDGEVYPFGITQEDLIRYGATIDGHPFGMEVTE